MYILVKTQDYQVKNKLQKAVLELLNQHNRYSFVSVEDVEKEIKLLKEKIAQLNYEHIRCKPVYLSVRYGSQFDAPEDRNDIRISVPEVVYLTYYCSK